MAEPVQSFDSFMTMVKKDLSEADIPDQDKYVQLQEMIQGQLSKINDFGNNGGFTEEPQPLTFGA